MTNPKTTIYKTSGMFHLRLLNNSFVVVDLWRIPYMNILIYQVSYVNKKKIPRAGINGL